MKTRWSIVYLLVVCLAGDAVAREACVPGYKPCGFAQWKVCQMVGVLDGPRWEPIAYRECCDAGQWVTEAIRCDGPWLHPYFDFVTASARATDFGGGWELDTTGVRLGLDLPPRVVGNALFEPSVRAGIGRGDATLTLRDDATEQTLFDGSTLVLSGQGDVEITPAPRSRWSFGAGIGYRTFADADSFEAETGRTGSIEDFDSFEADLSAGYSFLDGRLTPRIGARVTRSSVAVESGLGLPLRRFDFDLDKEEVIGTVEMRWTDALSTRFEISTDGSDVQAGAALTWHIQRPAKPKQVAQGTCVVDEDCPFGYVCDIDEPCDTGNPIGVCIRGCRDGERPCEAGVQCVDVTCKTCPCPDLCDAPEPCETAGSCKVDVWVDDTPVDHIGQADTGQEPDPNMAGKDFWKSRAIWVLTDGRSCIETNSSDHQNPEFGSPARVCVRVANIGEKYTPATTVEVYWANASTAQAWGGGGWKLAGKTVVHDLWAGAWWTAEIPWNSVPDPDTSIAGHFCLVARLVNAEDPMTHPETTDLPANVVNNNNIAWRNVTVVNFQLMIASSTKVVVRNLEQRPASVDLTFRSADGFLRDGGTVVVDLGTLFSSWRNGGGAGSNTKVLDGTRVELLSLPAIVRGIPMEAGAESVIALDIQAREPMNADGASLRHAFDVVQAIDGKEVGGMGYSILTRGRTTDTDHDRIYDIADPDDDNDSIPDADDPNPLLARDNVRPCSSGVTGILRGLHYPLRDYPTCEAVTAAVQSAATRLLPMFRSACASPDKTLPVSILGARVRSCAVSPPGSPGYVVAEVETCCPLPGEKCGQ